MVSIDMTIGNLVLLSLAIFVITLLIAYIYFFRKFQKQINDLKELHQKEIFEARKDARNRQRSTLAGQWSQDMAILFPSFPVKNLTDIYHFRGVVDFIAFEGMEEGEIKKIWLIDAKHSNYKNLSANQRVLHKFMKNLSSEHKDIKDKLEFVCFDSKEAFKEEIEKREE